MSLLWARASSSGTCWSQLPLEIVGRIASHLDRNEVACSFRHVNKAAAAQFSGPEFITVHLSQPVPPHAFAAHWLAPGSTRGLTLEQRQQLLCLTATSGVVANLEAALQAAGCPLTYEVFKAAAAAGELPSCQWLLDHGCPTIEDFSDGSRLLETAAQGGHLHMCEWLLSLDDLDWPSDGSNAAAHGGHVGLMLWLLGQGATLAQFEHIRFELPVKGAAHGCDLATLQRVWREARQDQRNRHKERAIVAAAGSPTPDWAAKVEWLEAQGCPRSEAVAVEVIAQAGAEAVGRLAWLRSRGYPIADWALEEAVAGGNVAAVLYLVLYATGWPPVIVSQAAMVAARGGHLHLLVWLLETFGAEAVELGDQLFTAAAESGRVELLAWLREQGCGWCHKAYKAAAGSGCEAALEWLAERGCPMPDNGKPYAYACENGDLSTARCLLRLGLAWGPVGAVFSQAVKGTRRPAPPPLLRWLLEAGCPVDLEAARAQIFAAAEQEVRGAAVALEVLDECQKRQEDRQRQEQQQLRGPA
ncbi:hypothetical protein GPECTOR_28g818 [Gonium pectorale]|uniref:Uncharacterized protein n=1 Tax=Gonium pectorale TaxID=33097 RepID=A0A150GEX6_GONPE|nr:hypothetical protein GPECTOR_28g818 [Gonium pectorale]|eukprot:KXZ48411.1 hypothetical protein GPECTOR_28g818 [Gonium pectorale]